MEHIIPEQIEQTVKGETCQNAAHNSSDILSRTPPKATQTLPNKYKRVAAQLPQKWV